LSPEEKKEKNLQPGGRATHSFGLFTTLSDLGDGTGPSGTDLNAGLTADAFVGVHRFRLAVDKLIDRDGTGVDALFTTLTLIFINNDFPHGNTPFFFE
jgi:hypothetical protein